MLKTYKEWSPTALDTKGLWSKDLQEKIPDYKDWFVAPCILTRDSDALDRSNYETLIKELENQQYEIASFNHWACGWFEIALVKPNSKAHQIAEIIKERLELYPILDEELMFQYESEDISHD